MNIVGKRILVTGGAGFIGSHTVDALIQAGAKISIIDNLSTGKRENIPPQAVFYNMNIDDPQVVKVISSEKPEIIYHFAFNVNVPLSVKNPLIEMESISGSIRIFNAAAKTNVKKIIFASSEFIYGNTKQLPATEKVPFDPAAPYSVSKYAVENYLQYYQQAFGIETITFRYSTVYGPRQIKGAMTDYIRQLSQGKQAEIWGDGKKTRDYLFIADVVRANLLALNINAKPQHYTFNLGTMKETSLLELYALIATYFQQPVSPIFHKDRVGEKMRSSLNPALFHSLTGWTAKTTLEYGLQQKIEDFLNPSHRKLVL